MKTLDNISLLEFTKIYEKFKKCEQYYEVLNEFFGNDMPNITISDLVESIQDIDYILEALNSHNRNIVKNAIRKHLSDKHDLEFIDWTVFSDNDNINDDKLSFLLILKNEFNFDLLNNQKFKNLLDFYGYYISYHLIATEKNIHILDNVDILGTYYTISPLWSNKVNNMVYDKNKGILYYFSEFKNKDYILHNGLKIKHNRSMQYPERIYLYSYFGNIRKNKYSKDVLEFVRYLFNNELIKNGISVFRVDLQKKIDFYTDDSMIDKHSVYTYNNIPAKYIKYIGEITYTDFLNYD